MLKHTLDWWTRVLGAAGFSRTDRTVTIAAPACRYVLIVRTLGQPEANAGPQKHTIIYAPSSHSWPGRLSTLTFIPVTNNRVTLVVAWMRTVVRNTVNSFWQAE